MTEPQMREEGKDQESIQSSTIPDPEQRMGKRQKHTRKHNTKESQEVYPLLSLSQQMITMLQRTDKTA